MSLRLRLALAALLLLVTLGGLGLLLVRSVSHSEISQVDQVLRDSFPVTRSLRTAHPLPAPPRPSPRHQFSARQVSALYIAAVEGGSRTVFSTPPGVAGAVPALPTTHSTPRDLRITTVGSLRGPATWRAIVLTRPGGTGELLVAAPLNRVASTLASLRLTLLVAGLVVLAVAGAVALWVTRLGLRPINEVAQIASAIAAGDRSRRVRDLRPGTEAASLARAFNAMRDEQMALEARLRQFVADASHELRSPVAAILGITDIWRRGGLRDEAAAAEAMRRIGQAGDQMGRLVEELLLLARLDEGQSVQAADLDLSALVREAVAQALSVDPSRPVDLDVPEGVVIAADGAALRRVVGNLVANAVRHTPSRSRVAVTLGAHDDDVELAVRDEGPGMTPEQVDRAFDRFWQANPSRSRAGSGLGLAIVRAVVEAHGGTVTLVSSPQEGTRVSVRLPRVARAAGTRAGGDLP